MKIAVNSDKQGRPASIRLTADTFEEQRIISAIYEAFERDLEIRIMDDEDEEDVLMSFKFGFIGWDEEDEG